MDAPSPAGAPMQSWLEKWSEWEIQAIVALSFMMQVILFFMAGIRRYSISFVLKVLLWLVYLLADTAAVYALGHMAASLSSKTSTDKHQLVAFWAPFLLLHLGGQDNITAYALEDNELWVRHLLNMFVQVAGTGYVLYKYIIADRAGMTIVSAAVVVSVAGFVKYGERIWALKCASKGSYYRPNDPSWTLDEWLNKDGKFWTYAKVVKAAHASLYLVRPFVIDRNEGPFVSADTIRIDFEMEGSEILQLDQYLKLLPNWRDRSAPGRYFEEVYRVIEVQLALMYEILYTKAEVLHTRYGYLLRGISFVSCFGALVAFTGSKRDRYSTPDIVITFVLLGGACTLEVASAFKIIGSTWTCHILLHHGNIYCRWLAEAILFARYHLIVVKDGRWSSSVGQYDFMSLCGTDRTMLKATIAGWIGLQDWWNKAHYTKHAKLTSALKKIVWGLLRNKNSRMVQIEDVAISSGYWARKLTGFNQSEELDWSLRMEFHNCVFIWHIATSTFLSNAAIKPKLVDSTDTGMAEAVKTLSDYMMYLLVQPDILRMNAAARSLFQKTYASFLKHRQWNFENRSPFVFEPQGIILDFLEVHVESDNISPRVGMATGEERKLYQDDVMSGRRDSQPGEVVLAKASILVRKMLDMELELTYKLEIMGRVWTEMLCYAATTASGDFHARQLSSGGEFLTHMLLLTKYIAAMHPQGAAGQRYG